MWFVFGHVVRHLSSPAQTLQLYRELIDDRDFGGGGEGHLLASSSLDNQ